MIKDLSKYKNYIETHKSILTVFVVTYNRADYLKLTLQSILEQTYKDFCLVVLDNASTDNTEELVNNIIDERLVYLRQDKNVGGPNNINTALKMAITPYFIIFHDDDLMLPDFIEKNLVIIQKYDFDILSSFAKHIDENGKLLDYYRQTNEIPISFSGTGYFESFFTVSPNAIYCPSVVYKNDFIKKNKLFFDYDKAGPACDIYLYLEIERLGGKIGILPLELFLYRRHSNQDSSVNNSFIQIQLLNCLLNNQYYYSLINNNKNIAFKFIRAIIIELMLSYNLKQDKQKLSKIIEQLTQLNGQFFHYKKLSLILSLCKSYPLFVAKSMFYSKKAYQVFKKLKYN